ncbi:hypothetical protein [Chryseobacterium indoltheticum]|uniref:hypothetical protein n=1 Tax=Chryseobacterium indoltheticum TaxID=254 RepID=UPI003F491923
MLKYIAIVFSKAIIPQNYTVEDLISLGKYIYYPFYFELKEEDRKRSFQYYYRIRFRAI